MWASIGHVLVPLAVAVDISATTADVIAIGSSRSNRTEAGRSVSPPLKKNRAEVSVTPLAGAGGEDAEDDSRGESLTVSTLTEEELRRTLLEYARRSLLLAVRGDGASLSPTHSMDPSMSDAAAAITSWMEAEDEERLAAWPAVELTTPLAGAPWQAARFSFVPGALAACSSPHTAAGNSGGSPPLPFLTSDTAMMRALQSIPLPRHLRLSPATGRNTCVCAVLVETVELALPGSASSAAFPMKPSGDRPSASPWSSCQDRSSLPADLLDRRLLLVGAGGIGCEVLKVLVLSGFTQIHLIDLDTIDATNLNRQFLFQLADVGASKAETARRVVLSWFADGPNGVDADGDDGGCEEKEDIRDAVAVKRVASTWKPLSSSASSSWPLPPPRQQQRSRHGRPPLHIVAHHDNITAQHFDDAFFAQFGAVLNALDNVAARRHVNHMCMRNGVPLLESGTMGYNGQVQPILKGVFECYECRPKPPDTKSFAVCTIHARPTTLVHCVHYAKELYEVLFGANASPAANAVAAPPEEEEEAGPDTRLASSDTGGGELGYLRALLREWRQSCAEPPENSAARAGQLRRSAAQLGVKLLRLLFVEKVEELLAMKSAWSTQPPVPLDSAAVEHLATTATAMAATASSTMDAALELVRARARDQVLSMPDCMTLFMSSVMDCVSRASGLPFRKEDDDAVRFVSATANLRAHVFHITEQSLEDVRSIAGAIVPAIASTNAIIAAAVVHELVAVLRGTDTVSSVRIPALLSPPPPAPHFVYARKAPQSRRRRVPCIVNTHGSHWMPPALVTELQAPSAALKGEGMEASYSEGVGSSADVSAHGHGTAFFSVVDRFLVHSTAPNPPNRLHCSVCQDTQPEVRVMLNVRTTTLGELVHRILEDALQLESPSVSHGSTVLYEAEDYEMLTDSFLADLVECPAEGPKTARTPSQLRRLVLSVDALNKEVPWDVVLQHEESCGDVPEQPFTIVGLEHATAAEKTALAHRAAQSELSQHQAATAVTVTLSGGSSSAVTISDEDDVVVVD